MNEKEVMKNLDAIIEALFVHVGLTEPNPSVEIKTSHEMPIFWHMMNPCGELPMSAYRKCSLPTPKPEKRKYDDGVKFSFYGCTGKCNHHKGVIVVASSADEAGGFTTYGTAYCSPKDVYDKEKGKLIAYQDMIENQTMVTLVKKKHHDINARVFADILANDDAPTWAKNSIGAILISHVQNAFNVYEGTI